MQENTMMIGLKHVKTGKITSVSHCKPVLTMMKYAFWAECYLPVVLGIPHDAKQLLVVRKAVGGNNAGGLRQSQVASVG